MIQAFFVRALRKMVRSTTLSVFGLSLCLLFVFSNGALQMFKDETTPTNNLEKWPTNFNAELNDDGSWKTPLVAIAYEKAGTYATADWNKIIAGFNKIKEITRGCIRFDPRTTAPNAPFWHAHPLRFTTDLVVCSTFNGKYTGAPSSVGQMIKMFRSDTLKGECVSQDRDILRMLLNTLGVANEYQRTDRDKALRVPSDPASMAHATLTGGSPNYVLGKNPTVNTLDPFDINSITMVGGSRYTKDGLVAFRQRNGSDILDPNRNPPAMSNIRISKMDCENLNDLYGCELQCDTPAFLPYEPVVPPKALKPAKLFSYLNCWDAAGDLTPDEINKRLGFLGNVQPEDDSITPNRLTWAAAPADGKFKVEGPSATTNSRNTAVFLRQRQTSVLFSATDKVDVTATDPTKPPGEEVVIDHPLGIELNCLPKFNFDGTAFVCAADQGVGTSATECTTNSAAPINTAPQACQSNAVTSLSLGPFMITDPDVLADAAVPQLTSMSVSVNNVVQPATSWLWIAIPVPRPGNSLLGYVVKTDTASIASTATITVRLSVADISSTVAAALTSPEAPPPTTTGRGAPVIKTLTAHFKVTCAAARSTYASLLGGANRTKF